MNLCATKMRGEDILTRLKRSWSLPRGYRILLFASATFRPGMVASWRFPTAHPSGLQRSQASRQSSGIENNPRLKLPWVHGCSLTMSSSVQTIMNSKEKNLCQYNPSTEISKLFISPTDCFALLSLCSFTGTDGSLSLFIAMFPDQLEKTLMNIYEFRWNHQVQGFWALQASHPRRFRLS